MQGRNGEELSSGILGLYHAAQSPAGSKFSSDSGPYRAASFYNILEDPIDGVLVEDAEVAIGMDVHLQRFEFEAFLVRHVPYCNSSKIRKCSLGADGRVLRNFDGDLIALILIGERFNFRQRIWY